jgi:hypothetical protein
VAIGAFEESGTNFDLTLAPPPQTFSSEDGQLTNAVFFGQLGFLRRFALLGEDILYLIRRCTCSVPFRYVVASLLSESGRGKTRIWGWDCTCTFLFRIRTAGGRLIQSASPGPTLHSSPGLAIIVSP